ncbi:MAG: class A beta-lactamase [Bryobacteraceae bacterium]
MKLLLSLLLLASLSGFAADPAQERLESELARFAKITDGTLGVAARHLESGRSITLNATGRYPMASTFKIPIAVQLLSKIDRGELRLDQMVEIKTSDLHPGSGTISQLLNKPGVSLSIRNLMELMLLISDNSATDILLKLAGGPAAVTAKMKELGLPGIRVDRSCAQLISDVLGAELPGENSWTPEMFKRLYSAIAYDKQVVAQEAFYQDPRDTAVPAEMTALLEKIQRKQLHKPESAELLLDILSRCKTGDLRIKGLLPKGAIVAHKTGTLSGIHESALATNDVGIITLPDGAGHVALSIFVKFAKEPNEVAEREIAQTARAIYDYFLYTASTGKTALHYDKLADRIADSLKLSRGERVIVRYDPGFFHEITAPLKARIEKSGAIPIELAYQDVNAKDDGRLAKPLETADVYLWMPFRSDARAVPSGEAELLKKWLDAGGPHREIHFHWQQGSVLADGLVTRHPAAYDKLYEDAVLDIDYKALAAAQDAVVSTLRFGSIRIRTPAGTDLLFRLEKRPVNKQDGDASAARMKSAQVRVDREIELPAGVVRVAPPENTVNGTLVIPEARFSTPAGIKPGEDRRAENSHEVVAKNIRFEIQGGRITKVTASVNQKAVEDYLKANAPASYRFRELGIGTNPKLTVQPGTDVLPYFGYGAGVVRISLGDNEEIGGAVRGGFSRWFFLPDATVDMYGTPLIKNGKLILD